VKLKAFDISISEVKLIQKLNRSSGPPLKKARSKIYSAKRKIISLPVVGCAKVNGVTDLSLSVALTLSKYDMDGNFTLGVITNPEASSGHEPRFSLLDSSILNSQITATVLDVIEDALKFEAGIGVDELQNLMQIVDPTLVKVTHSMCRVCVAETEFVDIAIKLKSDIVVSLSEDATALLINYNERIFDIRAIERFQRHIVNVITSLNSSTNLPPSEHLIIDESEYVYSGDEPSGYRFVPIYDLIERRVQSHAEHLAICDGDIKLTYRQMEKRVRMIVQHLSFIPQGSRLGICLFPSADQIIVSLAALHMGWTVVPIDYSLPPMRLKGMLEQSELDYIVYSRDTNDVVSETTIPKSDIVEICIAKDEQIKAVDNILHAEDELAYILFTSGTTGHPKGIMMSQGALSNLIQWQCEQFKLSGPAKVLFKTSLAFDVGFQEILSTLATGSALIVASETDRADITVLPKLIEDYKIDRLFLPPVALYQMAKYVLYSQQNLTSLNTIIVAGEQLKIDNTIIRFARSTETKIINQYGPTETHVVTSFELGDLPLKWPNLPSIGRPIQNVTLKVLNTDLSPTPLGCTGALYISGMCLFEGYTKAEDAATVTLPNDTRKYYASGDNVRLDDDGLIHFIGRSDSQVKIRGYRVELGEIEIATALMPNVDIAVATTHLDTSDEVRIVLYFVGEADPLDVRQFIRRYLPDYMVPPLSLIIQLDEVPLLSNQKVDVLSLPDPSIFDIGKESSRLSMGDRYVSKVCEVFQRTLSMETIDISETFLELGGDSLKGVHIVIELEEIFGVTLPLRNVLQGSVEHIAKDVRAIKERIAQSELDAGSAHCSDVSSFATILDYELPDGKLIKCRDSIEAEYFYNDVIFLDTYKLKTMSLPRHATILDIGANIGLFSLHAKSLFPHAVLHAIEPVKPIFDLLKSNLSEDDGGYRLHNIGIGERTGDTSITYYESISGMSTFYPDPDYESALLTQILNQQFAETGIALDRRQVMINSLAEKLYSKKW